MGLENDDTVGLIVEVAVAVDNTGDIGQEVGVNFETFFLFPLDLVNLMEMVNDLGQEMVDHPQHRSSVDFLLAFLDSKINNIFGKL